MGRLLRFSEGDQPNPGRQQLGYNDLSGQLRAGLDEFTGIKIAPFWLVAVLIMAYIACIGPLDYLLVKKVFKRMEFTWFTFPAIVLVVSVGAYYLAYWMKGEALLVNQVDVVDSDLTESPAAPRMRGVTWLNVFSPQMQSYDVTVAPAIAGRQLPGVERLVSWMGLPGTGFGGMNQMTADPPLFSRAYAYAPDLSRMIDVPIQVWSTKSFTARWHSAQGSPAGIEADLKAGAGDAIDGKLANRLPVPLADCLLAYGSAAYRIGDLKPGQEFTVEQLSRRRLADELKTRRTAAVAGSAIGWNAGSRDVPTIVEQMMFYQAAGGFAVTQLDNRYQRFIDFSNHLAMGQAILVGRAAQSAAPLQLADRPVENEHNKQWTIYRFLLPVKKR